MVALRTTPVRGTRHRGSVRGAWLVALALIVGVGCGKDETTDPVSEEDAARTEGGEVVRTGSGAAVNLEAHNRWLAGVELFNSYEEQGWNAQRCEEVQKKFESAVDAQPGAFAEARYMMGVARQRCGENDAARGHFEAAIEAFPKFCKARVALATMDDEAGKVREARAAYEQIIESDGQCTEAYVNLARIQAAAGGAQVDEAIQNLRRALAVEAEFLPAFNELALIYYRRGADARNRSSLDLAEIVARQAELINNKYAPIYNTWGLIKMRRGDLIEALRFFERAIELDSSLYEAQMNFGSITNSFRGYEDARKAYARAVELRPNSYDAIIGLGAALRGLNKIEEAEAQYNRARELNADRPEAYFNLALIYHDYKSGNVADLTRAKEYFQQFLQRAGQQPAYAEAKELVSRRCNDQPARSRARRLQQRQCRPGRIQLIDETIAAVREGEAMQREADAMQREAEQQSGE